MSAASPTVTDKAVARLLRGEGKVAHFFQMLLDCQREAEGSLTRYLYEAQAYWSPLVKLCDCLKHRDMLNEGVLGPMFTTLVKFDDLFQQSLRVVEGSENPCAELSLSAALDTATLKQLRIYYLFLQNLTTLSLEEQADIFTIVPALAMLQARAVSRVDAEGKRVELKTTAMIELPNEDFIVSRFAGDAAILSSSLGELVGIWEGRRDEVPEVFAARFPLSADQDGLSPSASLARELARMREGGLRRRAAEVAVALALPTERGAVARCLEFELPTMSVSAGAPGVEGGGVASVANNSGRGVVGGFWSGFLAGTAAGVSFETLRKK